MFRGSRAVPGRRGGPSVLPTTPPAVLLLVSTDFHTQPGSPLPVPASRALGAAAAEHSLAFVLCRWTSLVYGSAGGLSQPLVRGSARRQTSVGHQDSRGAGATRARRAGQLTGLHREGCPGPLDLPSLCYQWPPKHLLRLGFFSATATCVQPLSNPHLPCWKQPSVSCPLPVLPSFQAQAPAWGSARPLLHS